MKNIILGVTGSIAAYKAADIANNLTKAGVGVDVIMTKAACEFITPLTFQTLTKRKVHTDMFAAYVPSEVEHISLAQKADMFVIAPASADIIAKAACGIADDMLTTVLAAFPGKPVVICPAMNTAMYENPICQRNMNTLREFGFEFIEPKTDYLACGTTGKGAMASVDDITEYIKRALMELDTVQF